MKYRVRPKAKIDVLEQAAYLAQDSVSVQSVGRTIEIIRVLHSARDLVNLF